MADFRCSCTGFSLEIFNYRLSCAAHADIYYTPGLYLDKYIFTLIGVDFSFFEGIIMLILELSMDNSLTWDDSYAIALALVERHPDIRLEDVSLGMIYQWTVELPVFVDDKELANDSILAAIYQEWFEEVNPV